MKDCLDVKTIPQFTSTCWFNALLMALLYSDRTRIFFYQKLRRIHSANAAKNVLIEMFIHIINEQYTKVKRNPLRKFAENFKPLDLLQSLHDTNSTHFYFNPKVDKQGHSSNAYLNQLMRYFNLNKNVLYCNSHPTNGKVYVSFENVNSQRTLTKKYNSTAREIYRDVKKQDEYLVDLKQKTNFTDVDVLFIRVLQSDSIYKTSHIRQPEGARIYDGYLKETLYIGGFTYVLDSLIVSSLPFTTHQPIKRSGHAVAGVTCNGRRFLYNGWVDHRTNEPCPLMEFDWFKNSEDVCIDLAQCKFDKHSTQRRHDKQEFNARKHKEIMAQTSTESLCFNMKHSQRTYSYVKSNIVQTFWPDPNSIINLTRESTINLTRDDIINLTAQEVKRKRKTTINLTGNQT